jgi:hypothetical protein
MKRLAVLSLLAACSASATLPYSEQIVVTAYLYAYRPVTDIEVTSTIPLESADTMGTPILDATVRLTKRGITYDLSPSAAAGFYSYAGNDLTVTVGDTFDLTVVYDGHTATAKTIVPQPPVGLALSATEMTIDTSEGLPFDTVPFVVRWSNPTKDYFFTVVEPVDSSQQTIPGRGNGRGQTAAGSVFSAPTQADSAVIPFTSIHYFGPQRLRLYRVPPEYVALYESRQQDSRDLNEPATNIHGGLGIFSAFAGDSAFFNVNGGP